MDLNFTKMVPVKSYQHVVEQIEKAICDGDLREGDKLPSEMKLKDMFDISRGSVREALRVLEQKGLVSIRTGVKGGAVVKEANTEAMSNSIELLIRHHQISLEHLAEFRELLEGHAAEQAADIADDDDIDELRKIITKIQLHVVSDPHDWTEFHELDSSFHQRLAKMARNPLLLVNLETIHRNIHVYFQQYLPFSLELLKKDFADLCSIFEAVEKRDRVLAGKLARQHVAHFTQLMEKYRPLHDANFS